MPWFTKKRKKKASFDFSGHIQGRFRPFLACFGRFRPVSAVSVAGWYDPIWQIRPDFGRISPIRRESKPIRHKSSRIGANWVESAWIREKKKNADADRRAGNCVGCRILRRAALDAGAAPLVPRSSFLANKWLVRCNWTLNPNFGPFLLGFFYCWIVEVVLEGR